MITEDQIIVEEDILKALREVMDPEIPVLSVVDLGIIREVLIEDDKITVKMLPTFTACPAIKIMQQQIKEKIAEFGIENVSVEIDNRSSWNSDLMTEEGKKKLQEFGLGTPLKHNGQFSLTDVEHSACPHCRSTNTTMNSLFGSTLCRSIHYCFDCRQSFERFKPL